MFIEKEDDGIWLRDMPMWVVDTLLCLADWIESDNPDVQARLLPKAYEDDERDKEWRAALGDSLEHPGELSLANPGRMLDARPVVRDR